MTEKIKSVATWLQVISSIMVIVGLVIGTSIWVQNQSKQTVAEAMQVIATDLSYIKDGIADVKNELGELRSRVRELEMRSFPLTLKPGKVN